MTYWKRSILWTTAVLALLSLTIVLAAGISKTESGRSVLPVISKDYSLVQQKIQNGIPLTEQDKKLLEENAGNGQSRHDRNPLDNQGGPDGFGYVYVDNQGTDTATYAWIELRGDAGATWLNLVDFGNNGDDAMTTNPITIGFDFPFYGANYNQCHVGTNGDVQFTTSYPYDYFTCIPRANSGAMLTAFATDLHLQQGGNTTGNGVVGYKNFGTYWVLEYDSVGFYNTSSCPNGSLKYEAILYNTGRIKYQYNHLVVPTGCYDTYAPNIGIQQNGTTGTSLVYACGTAGIFPVENEAIWIVLPNGVPRSVTNFLGAANGTTVTLTWTDPNQDTNGNTLTPDSILLFRGDVQPASQIGHVTHGIQTFAALNQPQGNLTYFARAKAGAWLSSAASAGVIVGNPTYNNDFESDSGAWTTDGVWEYGTPTNPQGPQPHSGSNVWAVGLNANYSNSVCGHLDLNLGLPVTSNAATLEFWYWYQLEQSWDGCNVKVSVDGGNTWEIVTPQDGYPGTLNGQWACGGQEVAWTGINASPQWQYAVIPVGQYVNQTPIFRLTMGSDPSIPSVGFFLDDVVIWGLQPVVGVNVSGTISLDGGSGDLTQVTVRSNGLNNPSAHPNASGAYTLTNVQTGNRILSASLTGYQTNTRAAVVPPGGLTGQNITIRRNTPPAPTGLTASVNNANGLVTLSWDASPDPLVDQYRVYRKARDDADYTLVGTFTPHNGTDQLPSAGIYDYVVTAVDVNVIPPAIESGRSARVEVLYGALPPQMLVANGHFDDHIHLTWIAPGVPPEVEASYDDGVNEVQGIGWWGGQPPFGWLVTHYQGNGPITVTRLKSFITAAATIGSPIEVAVFADDGTGHPTFTPLGVIDDTENAPLDTFKEWTLNPALTFDDGSFFVAMRQMTASSICVGGDNTTPFINNTFFYSYDATSWVAYETSGLLTIPMQRCFVIGDMGGGLASEYEMAPSPVRPGASAWTLNRPSLAEKTAWKSAIAKVSRRSEKDAALAAITSAPTISGRPTGASARRFAERAEMHLMSGPRAPHLEAGTAMHRHSRSLDDVIRYRIYRNNVLHDSVAAALTSYNDFVAEGIVYTYRVTAFYDDGEESGPTNNATAMAAMAPGAPTNVQATPVGVTQMRITWSDPTVNSDGTPCVDLAGLRVYRNGTSLTPTPILPGVHQWLDIPPHNDSLYTWSVNGIDEVPNQGPGGVVTGSVVGGWMQVPYEWVDIEGVGTPAVNCDDCNEGPFDLGFPFEYYGNVYNSIRICSNGFASFTSTSNLLFPSAIPSVAEPNCALYPFWDDLYPIGGGQVLYYSDVANGRFVISWIGVPRFGGPTNIHDFQIVINSGGSVVYNYRLLTVNNDCLVGVENCNGTEAYQLCLMGAGYFLPHDSSSVAFWRGAMVFAPVTGHVSLDGGTGTVTNVTVTANGAGRPTVHPNASGNYTLDSVQIGNRHVSASLTGYVADTLAFTLDTMGYAGANFTLRREAPPVPTNLTGTVNTVGRKDSLHWDLSPDLLVDGYRVYRKMVDSLTWNLRVTVTPRTHNWVKDTLEVDGIYQYFVTAIDNDVTNPPIESAHSNTITNPFGHLPPQMLSVNGNFDNKYHLTWVAPGAPPEVEAFYDDGVNEVQGIGWWGGNPTFGWLVAHYQGTGAITVTRVKTYITAAAVIGSNIQICVFADAGGGVPTFTPLGVIDDTEQDPLDEFKEWTLTPPITFDNGSFFVGMRQIGTNAICVGGDNTTPFINNTFKYSFDGTSWVNYEPGLLTIPMQRCWVIGNMGGGLAAEYELAPSPVNSMAAYGFSALQSKTLQTLQAPVSGKTLALHNGKKMPPVVTVPALGLASRAFLPSWEAAERLRESVAPRAPTVLATGSSSRRGHSLDDVIQYVIYKDGNQLGTVPGTVTAYDDVPGSTHENQPHSFYVKARWDDNVLSPPSNTVANAVYNMAPAAPTSVSLTVVGQSQMRITWTDPTTNTDGLPCVDLVGLRVYRDGTLLTPTPVAPGVGQYTDTPPDPMQVYTWTVKAIDEVPNEGPGASGAGSVLSPWHTVDYQWVDITGIGTPTAQGDDINSGPINLGFSFTYYGNTYTTVNVCSNGWISFTDTGVIYWETCPLDSTEPINVILGFGADLYPINGECRYYADAANQRFIVSWDNCPHYSQGGPYNFQIILDSNGGVTLNYGSMADITGIVGVKNADGSDIISLWCQGVGPFTPGGNNAVQFWGGPQQAVEGIIRHLGGTNPVLANAQVWVTGGQDTAWTDNVGHYQLPVDPGTYTVHFRHAQHCDSVRTNIVVEANVNTTLNISMRSSAGSVSATSLTFVVHQNLTAQQQFTISNAASGWCSMHFQVVDSVTWLSSSPASGDINPGQSATITVTAAPGNMNPVELHTIMQVIASTPGSPFPINVDMTVLNVTELGGALPTEFALHQNYPNPFNPTTLLPFDVPQTSHVDIVIYNVMGQEVARPVSGKYSAGRYQVNFNAGDLPSGLYLVKMTAGNFHSMGKMLLLK